VALALRVEHAGRMEITSFGPDDSDQVAAYVEVANAVGAADSPWVHPVTPGRVESQFRFGWDGEAATPYLGRVDGVPVAVGTVATSDYDNLHLAWLGVQVRPEHRRRGLGSELLDALVAETKARGRTMIGTDGWDGEVPRAFAARHGLEEKSRSVNRRQHLEEVDWATVERLHAEAVAAAADYELVRRVGLTPDDELDAVAEMSAAINDAPTDDLDIEDEVYSPERVRSYEQAQLARGDTLHRVVVRHRETGELAGHSVVTVEGERPSLGHQHDTSVVATHRGHRLGLLVKTGMNLWLRGAQPQLVAIDTWNAESNDHMIGVNDAIGYRIMGRQLEFQKAL
jgi:GNAT superfamily N-acetyltransferase